MVTMKEMKLACTIRWAISVLSLGALLYAQSAAAACVCEFSQMGVPGMCAGVDSAVAAAPADGIVPPGSMATSAGATAPGAAVVHGAEPDSTAPCVSGECCAHEVGIGELSHPSLAHVAPAAPLYEVADIGAPVSSGLLCLDAAVPVRAIPPPHTILHCVFLI